MVRIAVPTMVWSREARNIPDISPTITSMIWRWDITAEALGCAPVPPSAFPLPAFPPPDFSACGATAGRCPLAGRAVPAASAAMTAAVPVPVPAPAPGVWWVAGSCAASAATCRPW